MSIQTRFNQELYLDGKFRNKAQLEEAISDAQETLGKIHTTLSMMSISEPSHLVEKNQDIVYGISTRVSEILRDYKGISEELFKLVLYKEAIEAGTATYYSGKLEDL